MLDFGSLRDGLVSLLEGAAGGAADAIQTSIWRWMARGLAILIEWIWSVLDTATTPRVTEGWFSDGLFGPLMAISAGVTVALMLASGIQAALAGRPEQILDAFRQAAWSIVASALTLTVIDVLLALVDEVSAAVWATGREDLVTTLEGVIVVVQGSGPLSSSFIGPLVLLFGYIALLGLAVALAMRGALIYVVAALAPLVFASSVLPSMRASARKLVHLAVALIVSKLAIVVTLVVALKLMGNVSGDPDTTNLVLDGAAGLGQLFAGFACFAIASVTPVVLYRLMPTVEAAAVSSGIAAGWGRGATSAMYAASTTQHLTSAMRGSPATASVPGGELPSPPTGATGNGAGGSGGGVPGGGGAAPASASAGSGAATGAAGGAASAGAASAAGPVAAVAAVAGAVRQAANAPGAHAQAVTDATTPSASSLAGPPTATSTPPATSTAGPTLPDEPGPVATRPGSGDPPRQEKNDR